MRKLALALLIAASPAFAYSTEVIQSSGPSDKRIDLVVLGDGYAIGDQAKLSDDARSVIDGLFQETPYKEYRALFNVKLVHVVSNQSGADNSLTNSTPKVDTALGAYFWCGGIDRLLCVDNARAMNVAAQDAPEFDVIIVVVNSTTYGGSGGDVTVMSMHTDAVQLLRHELSHTIGQLADEYDDAYAGFPACSTSNDCPEPNATLRNTRETAKWAVWIDSSTPAPTPEGAGYSGIGLFEGGRYLKTGMYRPKDNDCLMLTLWGTPHFCSVCREGLVRSFWRRTPVIESTAPAAATPVSVCEASTFSVTHPAATALTYTHLWTVDGAPVGETSNTLTVGALANGSHTVAVTARDSTALVRNDPSALLSEQAQWTIQACTAGPCDESASCSGTTCATTPKAAGTACNIAQPCVNGVLSTGFSCDGSGQCVAANQTACGAYTCDAAGAACLTTCSDNAQCASGLTCQSGACALPPEEPQGCLGCATGGGSAAWLGLATLGLALLRRRRTR